LIPDRGEGSTSCPSSLTPKKEPRHPVKMWQGGYQSQSGHFREEKNLLPLLGFPFWTAQPVV